ncbi:MAG: hypothetical protein AWM53_01494 [Candidatus Dichloromethanomonas elyunquensis]|nr:MAG: hypothetical protein AWM53_01494 [Candidatus Dichloromethanomonas elyunquensis]
MKTKRDANQRAACKCIESVDQDPQSSHLLMKRTPKCDEVHLAKAGTGKVGRVDP